MNDKKSFAGLAVLAVVAAGAGAYLIWNNTLAFVDSDGKPVVARAVLAHAVQDRVACHVYDNGSEYELDDQLPQEMQLAVISPTTAVLFDPNVTWPYWTRARKKISLKPLIPVTVKVWQLTTLFTTPEGDASLAAQRFADEWTGLKMDISVEKVVSLDITAADCSSENTLKATDDPRYPGSGRKIFDEKAINVYYTNSCGDYCLAAGLSCANDRRVNFVYGGGGTTTMLHELGHALIGGQSGLHWSITEGENNVMRDSSAPDRNEFSTGQVVVMNYEQSSVLSTLKLGGSRRDCAKDCPRLEFDEAWSCIRAAEKTLVEVRLVDDLFDCAECTGQQIDRVVSGASDPTSPLEGVLIKELDTILDQSENPYENNFRARKHRRSVLALATLARLTPSTIARQAINRAFENLNRYRIDVQPAIRASRAAIQ